MTIKKVQLGVKRKRGELGRRLDHHLLETERKAELAVDEPYAVEFDDRHGALALLDLVERDRLFLGGVTLGGRRGEHLEFDCVGVTLPRTNDRSVQDLDIIFTSSTTSSSNRRCQVPTVLLWMGPTAPL